MYEVYSNTLYEVYIDTLYEVYIDTFKDGKGQLVKIGEAATKREAAYLRRLSDKRTVIYKNGQFINAVGLGKSS